MYDSSVCFCVCAYPMQINVDYKHSIQEVGKFPFLMIPVYVCFVFEFHNTNHHHHLKIIEKIDPLSVCVCFKGSLYLVLFVLFSHFIWSKFLVVFFCWIIINFSFIHSFICLSVCLFVFWFNSTSIRNSNIEFIEWIILIG